MVLGAVVLWVVLPATVVSGVVMLEAVVFGTCVACVAGAPFAPVVFSSAPLGAVVDDSAVVGAVLVWFVMLGVMVFGAVVLALVELVNMSTSGSVDSMIPRTKILETPPSHLLTA